MGRLGVVALPHGRWRVYAGPVALLLAATVTIGLLRGQLRAGPGHHSSSKQRPAAHVTPPRHRVYVVRPGDTIEAISIRTSVPQAKILALNPKVSPTALFIGEKLQLP
jgi:spore germination protein YaaH